MCYCLGLHYIEDGLSRSYKGGGKWAMQADTVQVLFVRGTTAGDHHHEGP